MLTQEEIFDQIRLERERQDRKWGPQRDHSLPDWMTILGEEYGETCQEALRVHFGKVPEADFIEEMIQVAAVCVAALESLHYTMARYNGAESFNLDYTETFQQEKANSNVSK